MSNIKRDNGVRLVDTHAHIHRRTSEFIHTRSELFSKINLTQFTVQSYAKNFNNGANIAPQSMKMHTLAVLYFTIGCLLWLCGVCRANLHFWWSLDILRIRPVGGAVQLPVIECQFVCEKIMCTHIYEFFEA